MSWFPLHSNAWLLFRWGFQAWVEVGVWGWQEELACCKKKKKKNWKRKTGLFKHEIATIRNVWLIAKWYLIQDQNKVGKNKYNCQGVSKKHNDLYFEHYKGVLDVFHKAAITS